MRAKQVLGTFAASEYRPEVLGAPRSETARWLTCIAGLLTVASVSTFRLPIALFTAMGLSPTRAYLAIMLVQPAVGLCALWAIIVFAENRPLASVGIRKPTRYDLIAMLLITPLVPPSSILGAYIARLVHAGASAGHAVMAGQATLALEPRWHQASAIVLFALLEEIGDRAFAIERLTELTGSLVLASIAALTLVLLVHIPFWGMPYLLLIAPSECLLVLLYVWRRNAVVSITAHVLANAWMFWL